MGCRGSKGQLGFVHLSRSAIRGLRYPADLLGLSASGMAIEEVLEDHPTSSASLSRRPDVVGTVCCYTEDRRPKSSLDSEYAPRRARTLSPQS